VGRSIYASFDRSIENVSFVENIAIEWAKKYLYQRSLNHAGKNYYQALHQHLDENQRNPGNNGQAATIHPAV
jgi:hypothetical protein